MVSKLWRIGFSWWVIGSLLIFFNSCAKELPSPPISSHSVRSFDVFSQLETDLLKALQQGNSSVIEELVSTNFEYIYTDKLDRFNTISQLLDDTEKYAWIGYKISNVSIRQIGENYLVSFNLYRPSSTSQKKIIWSVQDYWTENNQSWKLLYRFIGTTSAASVLPPSYKNQEIINKRY